jgi:hypothetical protein
MCLRAKCASVRWTEAYRAKELSPVDGGRGVGQPHSAVRTCSAPTAARHFKSRKGAAGEGAGRGDAHLLLPHRRQAIGVEEWRPFARETERRGGRRNVGAPVAERRNTYDTGGRGEGLLTGKGRTKRV